ncbi:unnamed protein product [Prorocentrum cordatum]|uniref:PWI domain-containing protein n=1 Tax=Prorocentrum cordatum TaxID=2364126 RepID=A0ABN9TIZ8_9DINO|nr:unnamed protein product [Polarella glacialis]
MPSSSGSWPLELLSQERAKQKDEEERRRKEEDEARRKAQKEADEKRRREEEEAREQREKEERERREAEERKRREEREAEEAEQRKVQKAAAEKLLAQVSEEMSKVQVEGVPKDSKIAGILGTSGAHEAFRDDSPDRKHKPLQRLDGAGGPGEAKLRDDEMRRLIQQVPTDKAKAFAYSIDWSSVVEHNIIEKKLRPWVKKKVNEYLGAEEQGMVEFIMRKVGARADPNSILAELEGFLDEEAENFTLKMWRMLIFEVLRVRAR